MIQLILEKCDIEKYYMFFFSIEKKSLNLDIIKIYDIKLYYIISL